MTLILKFGIEQSLSSCEQHILHTNVLLLVIPNHSHKKRNSLEDSLETDSLEDSLETNKKQIVWKHRPNRPFFLYNLSSENYYNPVHASLYEIQTKSCGKPQNSLK